MLSAKANTTADEYAWLLPPRHHRGITHTYGYGQAGLDFSSSENHHVNDPPPLLAVDSDRATA